MLKFGGALEYLEDLAAEGRSVPALDGRPELDELQSAAFDAFWLASGGRQIAVGMSAAFPQPLTSCELIAVATACGLDPWWFLRVARVMDRAYLAHVHSTPDARTDGHRKTGGRPRPKPIHQGRS